MVASKVKWISSGLQISDTPDDHPLTIILTEASVLLESNAADVLHCDVWCVFFWGVFCRGKLEG